MPKQKKTINVPVDSGDSVIHIKLKIEQMEGIPLQNQTIIYGGHKLESDILAEQLIAGDVYMVGE